MHGKQEIECQGASFAPDGVPRSGRPGGGGLEGGTEGRRGGNKTGEKKSRSRERVGGGSEVVHRPGWRSGILEKQQQRLQLLAVEEHKT